MSSFFSPEVPPHRRCVCGGVDSAMHQWEDREEGDPPSKTSLCGEHDSQTKAQRPDSPGPGPGPGPGPSSVSMKSNRSMKTPVTFKDGVQSVRIHEQRDDSPQAGSGPGPSCVSLKSDRSMFSPETFKDGVQSVELRVQQQRSQVIPGDLDPIFKVCESETV
ncbi:hypothetical protein EYF80_058057 [Liparis tanakae]|uniref:Uncharacterized protein n=1 Tax=Liparis tanakae TaxID=230148 RepID=A0A4Z2ETT5_9TELE|nr:hypothetical protein EYF80_058057 [Liparis tanakae]